MAARRVAQSSINWANLAERVPTNQKASFAAFKSKADGYLRSVLENPETPPKIDWAYYKRLVPVSGLVDSFQKQYEALKVPYPADSFTAQVETQSKETKVEIDNYKKASCDRISQFDKEIGHLKSLLPYEQMTMEDYRDAYPDLALDPINRPTFWPHFPEDQLDHKDDQPAPHGH